MNLKFEEVFKSYKEYINIRLKTQSIRAIENRFKTNILPFWKNYNIYEISENDYIKWQCLIENKNYKNKYKQALHIAMVSFFNYCMKFYKLEKNTASIVGKFKDNENEEKKVDFYNIKEFKKFIKKVDNNVYKQFFNLMYFTGTRPGEAMALKFSDLSKYQISINKTIDERNNRKIGTPKTKKSKRKILIDKKLYKDLIKLKKEYQNTTDDYFIFGGSKPLAPTTINRHKIKACEKAKIRAITLHQFRHSHATLLLNKKIIINEISDRLGHSNVNTTLNIYTHSDLRQQKRVVKTLNFLRFF